MTIKGDALIDALGWKPGPVIAAALRYARAHPNLDEALATLARVGENPLEYCEDPEFAEIANRLIEADVPDTMQLGEPVPYRVWGADGIEDLTLTQMDVACRLPVSVRGAQMPDGHPGYGLPIGGVLATRDSVIPYAVGVDIGCRMKLTIVDLPANRLEGMRGKLRNALTAETKFGIGGSFKGTRDHDVLEDEAWKELPYSLRNLREKAVAQLGTSGSGNHFASWCEIEVSDTLGEVPAGKYLALLSHSGSRGFGAQIADRYTKEAMAKCSFLPANAKRLAWLDTRSSAGQEYWLAMNLAGRYAAANHDCIHKHVIKAAGLKPLFCVENAHNLAWKEMHDGEELIVHRKGATPAAVGQLGVIPGTMADPAFVVRGLGNEESLRSASHGAGRKFSRSMAMKSFTGSQMKKYLADCGVELISGGVDESPMAYKNIHDVMKAQEDLVEIVAKIQPRIVLMAGDGRSED